MVEVYFYHLDQKPLSAILPDLVQRGLSRGLRMAIETSAIENVQRLTDLLWSCEDTAFIPHGYGVDPSALQPLWLAANADNPNAATYRFYVDGALPEGLDGITRAIIMIDSTSEEAIVNARNEWKKRKAEGLTVSYWKQNERGTWMNLA